MRKYIFILVLIVFSAGCKKEKVELCSEERCQEYFQVWKNLFMLRNNFSESYFDEHIKIRNTSLKNWDQKEFFEVTYKYELDWLSFDIKDQFIILINEEESLFPAVNVNRGNYLTQDEINKVIDGFAFNSQITIVAPEIQLKFNSEQAALNELAKQAEVSSMRVYDYNFKKLSPVFSPNGHPYLYAVGTINESENECIVGDLDLVTGVAEIRKAACSINSLGEAE